MDHAGAPGRLSDRDIASWLIHVVTERARTDDAPAADPPSPEQLALEESALRLEQDDGRLTIDTRLVDGSWHTVLHFDDGATVWIPMPGDADDVSDLGGIGDLGGLGDSNGFGDSNSFGGSPTTSPPAL